MRSRLLRFFFVKSICSLMILFNKIRFGMSRKQYLGLKIEQILLYLADNHLENISLF